MRIFATSILSFLATASLATAIIVAGPGEIRSKAFMVVLLTPLVWAALMVYAYWDAKAWRPAVYYSGLTGIAAALILLTDGTA